MPTFTPLQRKTFRNSCNPKELPIYFSMIKKKCLFNILQQKLQIYTDWFQQRSAKSLVCFLLSISPPIQKLHPRLFSFNTHYCCLFLAIVLWFEVFRRKNKKKSMNTNMIFSMQADLVKWNKMENKEKGTSGPY